MKNFFRFSPPWFWVFLVLLTFVQTLASCEALPSLPFFLWILLGVVPLTILLAWVDNPPSPSPPLFLADFLPEVKTRYLFLGLGVACFVRFLPYPPFLSWPTGDEALTGLTAIQLNQHWDFRLFFTAGQDPPTVFWLTSLFFRVTNNPALSLWLSPLLISCLSVWFVFLAARKFFGSTFSFWAAGLWALSYWPLQLGRADLPAAFSALWVPLTLYAMGGYFKSKPDRLPLWGLALGMSLGLNWLTFTSWPFFVLAVLAAVVYHEWKIPDPSRMLPRILLALGFIAGLTPFLCAASTSGFGKHIADVTPAWNHLDPTRQTRVALDYLSVLFWGAFSGDTLRTPDWGGFLNPFLGALFCLGLGKISSWASKPLSQWLWLYAFLTLAPGFLSLNMNGDRIVQVLPFLILVTAGGGVVLLSRIPLPARVGAALLVLSVTLAWDEARIRLMNLDPVIIMQTEGRSVARYRAFEELKKRGESQGPGWILGEWDVPADWSLEVMTRGFNALGSTPSDSNPHWLAVITDSHYFAFLKTRFPEGYWKILDGDINPESPRLLGVLSINGSNRSQLEDWVKADSSFKLISWDLGHLHDPGIRERWNQDVQEGATFVQKDPLLASMYWEKVGSTDYVFGGLYPQHLAAMENAVKYGYPASHLYGELATLYWVGGNRTAAHETIMKAQESDKRYPWKVESP